MGDASDNVLRDIISEANAAAVKKTQASGIGHGVTWMMALEILKLRADLHYSEQQHKVAEDKREIDHMIESLHDMAIRRDEAVAEVERLKGEVVKLRQFIQWKQEDMVNELERRKRSPGGQQAGIPRYGHVPQSFVMELERDCRHMLEATK